MIRLVREIKTEKDLEIAVEETRKVLLHNDPSLVEECTIEQIKKNTKMMQECLGEDRWTHEDSLCDLIYESWGPEDN